MDDQMLPKSDATDLSVDQSVGQPTVTAAEISATMTDTAAAKLSRRYRNAILFVIFYFIFLAIMDYPFFARKINAMNTGHVVQSYRDEVENAAPDALEMARDQALFFNAALLSGEYEPKELFKDENGLEAIENAYKKVLTLDENGVMCTVRIPKIRVDLPVYHSTDPDGLNKGAVHLMYTSIPIGGLNTHTVLSAHRGLADQVLFTNLDLLEEGDIVYIDVLGETLEYRVYDIEEVSPTQTESLLIQEDRDLLTLVTCTPYGINTKRLLVHCERHTPYVEEEDVEPPLSTKSWLALNWYLILNVLLILFMVAVLYVYLRTTRADAGAGAEDTKADTAPESDTDGEHEGLQSLDSKNAPSADITADQTPPSEPSGNENNADDHQDGNIT